MITYHQQSMLDLATALSLYEAVGWTNYTQNPKMLEKALTNSLYILAAYDGDNLVGLLRAVGDGASILFIQDILVLPVYQRQGIGRELLMQTLQEFNKVYQLHLLTDQTEKTTQFYQALGFLPVEDVACRAFTYMRAN